MSGSSRWCPTPEQLMILEEIYKGGIRTPNASQIQNITCKLSRYGKIEGKNVFYWFQNHKARDRQKLRRKQFLLTKLQQIQQQQQQQQQHNYDHHQHLLLPSATPSLHHPPLMHSPLYNYPVFHHQGNGGDEYSYTQVKQSSLKTADINPNIFENKSMVKIYDDDDDNWRVESNHSTCCNRSEPLKTLQLFPTKSNNLI